MDKLCRFLQADPMYSIDDVLRKPKLGFCSNFHVEKVQLSTGRMKPLMFFEGTPTNLGCTILLYGATLNELTLVKSLTRFMIYVVYNSKLEQSFIFDKYADFSIKKAMHELNINLPLINSEMKIEESTNQTVNNRPKEVKNIGIKNTQNEMKGITVVQSPLEDEQFFNEQSKKTELRLEICEEYSNNNNFQKLSRNFKQLLDDILLSSSPFIQFKVPVLLQENRGKCMTPFYSYSNANFHHK